MVSEERIALLDFWWDVEDPYDPESMEWRNELNAEEAYAEMSEALNGLISEE